MLWKRKSRHFLSHTIVCAFEKTLSCLPYPDCNLKIAIHKILMIGPGNLFINRFFGGLIFGLGRGEGGGGELLGSSEFCVRHKFERDLASEICKLHITILHVRNFKQRCETQNQFYNFQVNIKSLCNILMTKYTTTATAEGFIIVKNRVELQLNISPWEGLCMEGFFVKDVEGLFSESYGTSPRSKTLI